MDEHAPHDETRRRLLGAMAAVPFLLSHPHLLRLGVGGAMREGGPLAPTPQCRDDDDDPTPSQTEGPFFTPRSPKRTSLLETGVEGTRLTVTGTVVTRSCRPVAGALVDFWQADDDGEYDNAGYRLRGHQFTDAQGRYRLDSVVPGLYPGRTRHIHVKVQAPGKPILTTQLYFPGEARNARDGIFHPDLVLKMAAARDRRAGRFDFVLDLA
jgi:protocatechuate 3,4-dioxygenase beta subunit